MTGLVGAPPHGIVDPARAARRRVRQLLRTEVRLLRRFHVVTATIIVTALWVAVLLLAPAGARRVVAPLVLLTDVTALSFLFVPALLVLERMEGVEAALRMTPASASERIGVRVGATAALSLIAGAAVGVGAGLPDVAPRLVAVATMSVFFGLVAAAATGRAATLTTFLIRAPLIAVPLLTPALVYLLGLADAPVLDVSPVTSAVDMMYGRWHWTGLTWQLTCIAGVALLVARTPVGQPAAAAPAGVRRARRRRTHPGRYTIRAAVGSFARTDRRTLPADRLALMLLASVPLVALVVRVIGTVGVDWAQRRYGVALEPYLPLVQVVLLVIHTPVIFGALSGLLLLEDRDAGLLGPVAVTRATVATLVAYRLAASVLATALALGLSLPVAAVGHPAGVAGYVSTAVAAGAASVVPALLIAAVARNRVQGVAVMKVMSLPLYLPIAAWFAGAPARWLLAPVPTAWAAWAAWAATPGRAVAMALGAGLVSAGLAVPLVRQVVRNPNRS